MSQTEEIKFNKLSDEDKRFVRESHIEVQHIVLRLKSDVHEACKALDRLSDKNPRLKIDLIEVLKDMALSFEDALQVAESSICKRY